MLIAVLFTTVKKWNQRCSTDKRINKYILYIMAYHSSLKKKPRVNLENIMLSERSQS